MTKGKVTQSPRFQRWAYEIIPHIILIGYCVIALYPIVLIVVNSFKSREGIFGEPYAIPTAETFSTIGYDTVFSRASLANF
jgi:raffinose/stachyose/melibiose transport system permease protein